MEIIDRNCIVYYYNISIVNFYSPAGHFLKLCRIEQKINGNM